MHLTPREIEKLMLYTAGEVAKKRRERGLKLNYPEAIALISAELLERARDGMSVEQLMEYGAAILTEEDVMDGISAMIDEIQVEATFPDGTKLVTIHQPIRPQSGKFVPGETICGNGEILCNAGRKTVRLCVCNTGDRPVQIGSHFHFFEVNRCLDFDRKIAFGMRLNIAAGTGVRFEPGEQKEVELVALSGEKTVYGLNGLTEGPIGNTTPDSIRQKAADANFKGV